MSGNEHNTHGVPDVNPEADTASGGAPEEAPETTDDQGRPLENPSGG